MPGTSGFGCLTRMVCPAAYTSTLLVTKLVGQVGSALQACKRALQLFTCKRAGARLCLEFGVDDIIERSHCLLLILYETNI